MRTVYRIGIFSQISKTTIKTIRYYDETGLLKPAYIDEESGYRYYDSTQLVKLHEIISLRQMGFSISEISVIIKGGDMDGFLAQRKAEIMAELAEAQDRLSRINHYIAVKKEGLKMNYQAVLKELPECIVYYKQMTVPDYDAYFQVIPAIGEEVSKANPGLECRVPAYCFITYLDGEYKEKDFNIEFCEAVESYDRETDEIKFKKIPGVTAVTVMHQGPYRTLSQAYAYIFKWIEDNGYTVKGHPRESYIDGIWNKESEKDWLTELQVPVMKINI